MDALVCARSLLTKLVTGEVENLKALRMEALIELLQLLILRCKATLRGRVDNQQHLVGILPERDLVAFAVFHGEFINSSHFFLIFLVLVYY